jgi:hypothetical protein
MEDLEGEGFSEEIIKNRTPRRYWIPTLWLTSLILVGAGGYLTAGAEVPPGFLAAVGEAWSNMFIDGQEEFVEVIDTNQSIPQATLFEEPDRVFTRGVDDSVYPVEAGVVASRELCTFYTENLPTRDGVIISEVAWMGGLENEDLGPSDEWIEIKNQSSEKIDISGWQLIDSGNQIKIVFPAGFVLNPGSYSLLERTDDYSAPGVTADIIYSGNLSNNNEGLRLFNARCGLEDEVLANPDWPAGDAYGRRTMERSVDLTWHTYSGPVVGGILGTPKRMNSEFVVEIADEYTEEELYIGENDSPLCSQNDLGSPTHEVLINEVAWSGQSENTSEEWIELYNPSSKSINLSSWQLVDKENSIVVVFDEGDEVDEYFLLRRILSTDNPSGEYLVGNKPVDKTYTGVIQNSDESLKLFNSECVLVDEVDGVGNNWGNIGGTASPDYRSAERTDEDDWHTYSGSGRNGIMGTPRAANSVPSNNFQKISGGGGGSSSGAPNTPQENIFSYCPQDDLNSPTHIVYINEIAWAGTASSTSEEWLELYTPVGGGLSLKNWQLLDKDGEIKIVFDDKDRIDDYLLLKRILTTDDPMAEYQVGGVIADVLYEGVLQNDEETLRLFDASCNLVDEVVDVGAGWASVGGSASPDYRTAERTAEGWQTYLGVGENGVMGTPRAENSIVEDPPVGDNPPDEEDPPTGGEEDPPVGGEDPGGGGIVPVNLEITEIIFDVEGADDGQERVKITNNGDVDVAIETFSVQYLRVGGDISTIKKKNFASGNVVLAGGDFVVGMSCSTAVPCVGVDMSWSQALANDGGTVYLVSNQENITGSDDLDIVHFLVYTPVGPSGGG